MAISLFRITLIEIPPENTMNKALLALLATLATVSAVPAHAAISITEVAPWASGNSAVSADWFELTNTGASAVAITGWKMDDSSATFGSSVALTGISSIAAGESVIFIEGTGSANATFLSTWFGANAPAGLQIGNYSGSGVGLSTSGDGVTIFNASGVQQAIVTFGVSNAGYTFDNAAGATGSISALSVIGVNGAFLSADSNEIGSPGTIAAVPEAETYAMMLAGLALVGAVARKRQA
jgi:hypothetical protein